jgi:tetraacyldisaccharide 4'-kinase
MQQKNKFIFFLQNNGFSFVGFALAHTHFLIFAEGDFCGKKTKFSVICKRKSGFSKGLALPKRPDVISTEVPTCRDEVEKSTKKTDFSTRLRLARNDILNSFQQGIKDFQLNQEAYRKLISGESGCRCPCVGLILSFAAPVYAIVIRLRNFLYSKGWFKTYKVNAAVISIGNITVGGTGKTPLVVWVCKFLEQKNIQCAILTRGYKTHQHKRASSIDEPAIFIESCPQASVIVNPDRVAGAAEAINKFGAKALIMDDGFQHRRLHRDIDIVTIDATCPLGYGRMLPAGLLREPVAALKRVDAVVITRCDQVSEAELSKLEEKIRQVNSEVIIARSIHKPICAKSINGKEIGIEQLKGKKIFAFCGIGNPQAFLDTIKNIGAEVVGFKIYDDHHHYSSDDATNIYKLANNLKAELILTTQKDRTKIPVSEFIKKDIPMAYLVVEANFISGEDKLKGLIEEALSGKILKN